MAHVLQSTWMRCIIQCDFPDQMEVFRWLVSDITYQCCYILHDRDEIKTEDEEHERTMPDGSTKEMKIGMRKFPHYHMIVRIPKKLSADTFSKRFGNYVHFQVCSDPANYCQYFMHKTFISRNKVQYSREEIKGDSDLICELLKGIKCTDSIQCVRRFTELLLICNNDEHKAIQQLCAESDADTLKSIMAHPYFYARFVAVDKKGG